MGALSRLLAWENTARMGEEKAAVAYAWRIEHPLGPAGPSGIFPGPKGAGVLEHLRRRPSLPHLQTFLLGY